MKNRKFQNLRLIAHSEDYSAALRELADRTGEQDYLQIFEITTYDNGVSICHRQECPIKAMDKGAISIGRL